MLTLFGRKKLAEEKVAHLFVNAMETLIDEGFEQVLGLINDSPEFLQPPNVDKENSGPFTMVVLAGNLQIIPKYFDAGQEKRIIQLIFRELAERHDRNASDLAKQVNEMRKFMMRKNHPSKSVSNAMAKALFCRYGLNQYQERYFKSLDSPNPIFIQRLKDAMENFLWNWEAFQEKYKVVYAV